MGLGFLDKEEVRPELFFPPGEGVARRWLSASQEDSSHQELNLLAP